MNATKNATKTAAKATKAPMKTEAPTRRDVFAEITERFASAIEDVIEGRAKALPWQRPWGVSGTSGLPFNGATKRRYNGVNVILLWMSGYSDSRWYTFNQARDLGAFVKKGEKATPIVFWNFIKKTNDEGKEETIPFLRHFSVFNRAQIDWSNSKDQDAPVAEVTVDAEKERDASVEALRACILAQPMKLSHGGDVACYRPSSDEVMMPPEAKFVSSAHYVATLAHEGVHWSGHSSRLDRKLDTRFGSESYAMEELVAELGAAFLCAQFGVASADLDDQHKAYLTGWAKRIREDKYAIFTASRHARAAAEFFAGKPEMAPDLQGAEGTEDSMLDG